MLDSDKYYFIHRDVWIYLHGEIFFFFGKESPVSVHMQSVSVWSHYWFTLNRPYPSISFTVYSSARRVFHLSWVDHSASKAHLIWLLGSRNLGDSEMMDCLKRTCQCYYVGRNTVLLHSEDSCLAWTLYYLTTARIILLVKITWTPDRHGRMRFVFKAQKLFRFRNPHFANFIAPSRNVRHHGDGFKYLNEDSMYKKKGILRVTPEKSFIATKMRAVLSKRGQCLLKCFRAMCSITRFHFCWIIRRIQIKNKKTYRFSHNWRLIRET